MPKKFEEIAQGLWVRKDTPKEVRLTPKFISEFTKGSDSKTFICAIQEIAETESAE